MAHIPVTVKVRQVVKKLRAGGRREHEFLKMITEMPPIAAVEKGGRGDDERPGLCQ